MTHSGHDPSFAFWAVFRNAPRWWLARGCPPPVSSVAGWLRVMRAVVLTTVTAALGAVLGGIIVGCLVLTGNQANSQWVSLLYGGVFAGIVLIPASRWMGRRWWHAVFSVPYLAIAFRCMDDLWQRFQGLFGSQAYASELTWLVAMSLLGGALGTWMISPSRPRTWIIPLLAVGAAWVGALNFAAVLWIERRGLLRGIPGPMPVDFILRMQPLIVFLALAGAGMSLRLWRNEAADQVTPDPAANTLATGAEKPSSSTDAAVSPDLNTP